MLKVLGLRILGKDVLGELLARFVYTNKLPARFVCTNKLLARFVCIFLLLNEEER